jgi:hypothetical protein
MRNTFFILLVMLSLSGVAQKPVIHFTFEGIGDNREYHNGLSKSQTILGTLGSMEFGLQSDRNSLYGGISELYEFGSTIDFNKPKFILYYKFEDTHTQFHFGSIPRRGIVDFPLAMLADTLAYYRPQIEGMAGKMSGKWGYQMAFVDWTGRQTKTIRESFMVGSSGEIKAKNWFLQNYILLNHLAHTAERVENLHIRDNFGFSLLSGMKTGSEKTFSGMFKGGLMTSLYRERSVTDGFQIGNSFYFEGYGQYSHFAIKTTLHAGDKLQFAHGDPLYRLKNYLRADAIWNFIHNGKVKARFNWSFHVINWKSLDHSQQLFLVYQL